MISYLILIHDIMYDIMDIYIYDIMYDIISQTPDSPGMCNYPGVCISLVWYARPQLFFNCTLCPTGAKESMYSASHKEVSLVYFSTFKPIALTPDSIMQLQGPCSPWKRLRRHAAGQGQRQQAVRGEHLDVALRQGPPPDGVHSRG